MINNLAPSESRLTSNQDNSANPLEPFFGPIPAGQRNVDAGDAYPHETYNLPKAYEGRNKYLMSTIDFLITENDDWYTRYVLPYQETDDIHIKWNVWRFNKTLADIEPHQGVPRYVTAESELHSDSLLRRGLAFIIEHGFYQTETGRNHYMMNLRQIVEAIHETCYFGVIHALLHGKDYYREWQRKYGVKASSLSEIMQREKNNWACVQKKERGLYLLDAECKNMMSYEGVTPNLWIFPSKMSIYVSMVPSSEVEYFRKGPGAADNLERGPDNFQTFRGCKVFETRPFDIDFVGEPVDLLRRNVQIGEYYFLENNKTIKIFNMATDDFEIFSAEDDDFDTLDDGAGVAVNEMGRINAYTPEAAAVLNDPQQRRLFDEKFKQYIPKLRRSVAKDVADEDVLQSFLDKHVFSNEPKEAANMFSQLVAHVNEGKEFLKKDLDAWKTMDSSRELFSESGSLKRKYSDFKNSGAKYSGVNTLLICRPWMEYRMASAILCKGGSDLGNTFHGHHDFQLTDDVIHKVHIGHYTFYSKAVVKNPKNYIVAENVFAQGYVKGESMSVLRNNQNISQRTNQSVVVIDLCTINTRSVLLNGDNKTGDFVMNPICLSGDLPEALLREEGVDIDDFSGSTFSTYDLFSKQTELGRGLANVHNSEHGKFIKEQTTCNTVCWLGKYLESTDDGATYKPASRGTGHWGDTTYPGCKSVRMGANTFFEEAKDQVQRMRMA